MVSVIYNVKRFALATLFILVPLLVSAKTFLVSVGVADYSDFPQQLNNLTLTTNDARTITDIYSKNTEVDYALLLDKKATKSRILKAIRKVFGAAKENDIVVFFFSGHGYAGGFCAADGKVSYNEIRKAMAPSKSKNKMMFVDACRAGGMRVSEHAANSSTHDAKNSNVLLFLSSRNTENSRERPGMSNGFFTYYLQSGLKGSADADRNRIITARELFDYVYKGVIQLSDGEQHPVMWGKFNDNMPVMAW